MRIPEPQHHARAAAGFTLPAILIVTGALLILAVGILLVASIERSTARSFVDRQRADLAAHAALEDVRGILTKEAANDDFLIISSTLAAPIVEGRDRSPYLFITRGKPEGNAYNFRYFPLFSASSPKPDAGKISTLAAPKADDFLQTKSEARIEFPALPYRDKVRADWLPVKNAKGKTIARYAYWVEDLQGRIDPGIAGNEDGAEQTHSRETYPFPAPGLDDPATGGADQKSLNQIAIYAIDPAANETNQAQLGKTLFKNRKLLVSPESILAAAAVPTPLTRDSAGHLLNPIARAAEESMISGIQPYEEQPIVPFLLGIQPSVAGKPKLNLNKLVAQGGRAAVDEMAAFIDSAYPTFVDRKGGFPDNYVKTLSANAIDYADKDNKPTLQDGEYRGIDNYPLDTELALKVAYQGKTVTDGRQFLNFQIKLFAEMHNPTNRPVSGDARLSYEVALYVSSIGTGTGSPPFDSDALLDNPKFAIHNLDKISGKYWSKPVTVVLSPNEFRCFEFASVTYFVDQGDEASNPISDNTPFSLIEEKAASGSSLKWNEDLVERQLGLVRQQGFIYGVTNGQKTGGYLVGTPDVLTKSHYPALLYQKPSSAAFYGNTGDPRISHYMNRSGNTPLDESAYPENASPNRRSVRWDTYKEDEPTKPKVYARMLPSEWSDGGHDCAVGSWKPGANDATELDDAKFNFPYDPDAEYAATQMISNRGFYYSATELGRVFDPIMFAPTFAKAADTTSFRSKSVMPAGERSWPDAKSGQASPLYGGGNTLRIGRPEHPAFNLDSIPQNRAIGLLDLFHTGLIDGEKPGAGPLVKVQGRINVNTASRDALRAIAAGALAMDPKLSKTTDTVHVLAPKMAPPVVPLKLDAPKQSKLADIIADAVISGRPYGSASSIALAKDGSGREVFGNRDLYPDTKDIQWSDAAAEEVFARVYEASTVRSRNFRVWVVAQSLAPTDSVSSRVEVLSEVRKTYGILADPGERAQDGAIIPANIKIKLLHTNDF